MHALTEQELVKILESRNYEMIQDQNGAGWLAHKITGNCYQIETIEGQDYCQVARSTANLKSTKSRGDYWFVNRDPDLNQIFEGAVVMDGEIFLLNPTQTTKTEVHSERRDAVLAERN